MTKTAVSAFVKTFFFIDFYKNDIIANLADAFPGDAVFAVTAKEAAEFSGAGYDQGGHSAGFTVKLRIDRTPETAAGTDINYFFLL